MEASLEHVKLPNSDLSHESLHISLSCFQLQGSYLFYFLTDILFLLRFIEHLLHAKHCSKYLMYIIFPNAGHNWRHRCGHYPILQRQELSEEVGM